MYDYIVLMNIYVCMKKMIRVFFFSSRRRHTRWPRDWSSDVCSSDHELQGGLGGPPLHARRGDRRFEGEPGGDHGIVGIDHRGQPFTGMVEGGAGLLRGQLLLVLGVPGGDPLEIGRAHV